MLALALAATSHAHADVMPPGKVGGLVGLRNGVGATDGEIGFGWAVGVEASWQPMGLDQRLGWGVNWSLLWAYFGDEAGARITRTLDLLELDVGGRLRLALRPGHPQIVFVGAGAGLIGANAPHTADQGRTDYGVYAAVGAEHGMWGIMHVTLELRTGFLGTEPTLATGLLGVGVSL